MRRRALQIILALDLVLLATVIALPATIHPWTSFEIADRGLVFVYGAGAYISWPGWRDFNIEFWQAVTTAAVIAGFLWWGLQRDKTRARRRGFEVEPPA